MPGGSTEAGGAEAPERKSPKASKAKGKASASVGEGALEFDGAFETGNLGVAKRLSKYEWEVRIRPDTHNERHRLWFNFKVRGADRGQGALFSVPNFSKGRSMYRHGMSPLVRSRKRPSWQRLPPAWVLYYRVPKRKAYVLSFFFTFDDEEDEYQFAYCFPYGYTDLQRLLYRKDLLALPSYRRELLCRTPQHRRVDLLTITAPGPAEHRRVVVLTARVHPGESPASFIMQGAVDFLTSGDPRAEALRQACVFKLVPMLNPDGVALGNYRCNSLGYDMNRYWDDPSPALHPELFATKQLLLASHARGTLDLFIDMHSHSAAPNAFMFANSAEVAKEGYIPPPRPQKGDAAAGAGGAGAGGAVAGGAVDSRAPFSAPVLGPGAPHINHPHHPGRSSRPGAVPEEWLDEAASLAAWAREACFPRLLGERSPSFSLADTRFDADPAKEGTGRRALGSHVGKGGALCYTLEASFYGFAPKPAGGGPHRPPAPRAGKPIGNLEPFSPERCVHARE